jgi:hypothetical protein
MQCYIHIECKESTSKMVSCGEHFNDIKIFHLTIFNIIWGWGINKRLYQEYS